MKKYHALLLAFAFLFGASLSTTAFAGQKAEEIQGRQDIQTQQIQQGVNDGSLTKSETDKLIKGQDKINKTEQHALSDDKMSRHEFHKLEHMQNKESKNIEKKVDNNSKEQ